MNLSVLRREYCRMSLSKQDVNPDPFLQFHLWLNQALEAEIEDASAMALSTVSPSGFPSGRMVLLKELDEKGFVFFTSYTSRKGQEIMGNDQVSLLFYWKELERQVRICGIAQRMSREESAAYFYSRPIESQISALISPQSDAIEDRIWLSKRWDEAKHNYVNETPPMPENWGGYRVAPTEFEFFQGREHRLHDRIHYGQMHGGWLIERLAP
ncbi:MAG: pyridoxamine 5'-phosphate oxidase [Bacteroidales bacterium]|nr:pyridoxamine 5'-phosphate oxidase [Bacteroidales bacterium]